MRVHCITMHCTLALNHVTGKQALDSLRSPALWFIFEAVLGILFKLVYARDFSIAGVVHLCSQMPTCLFVTGHICSNLAAHCCKVLDGMQTVSAPPQMLIIAQTIQFVCTMPTGLPACSDCSPALQINCASVQYTICLSIGSLSHHHTGTPDPLSASAACAMTAVG